jgi:hypothetical protein
MFLAPEEPAYRQVGQTFCLLNSYESCLNNDIALRSWPKCPNYKKGILLKNGW